MASFKSITSAADLSNKKQTRLIFLHLIVILSIAIVIVIIAFTYIDYLKTSILFENQKNYLSVISNGNSANDISQYLVQISLIVIGLILIIIIPIISSTRSIYRNQMILENEIEARKKSTRQAEALARCASHLNSKLDLISVSEAVCEEAALTLDVPVALVQLYDETTDDYQFMATYGVPEDIKVCAENILRNTIRTNRHAPKAGRLNIVPDISILPTRYQSLCEQLNIKTMVSVKLLHEATIIGYLNVFSIQSVREFREDELALLEALSDYMSASIYNARLFEQIKSGRERMKTLSQKLVETQESEKRHLARELHDEIGQNLTHIKMSLDQIVLDNDHPQQASLLQSQNLVQELMNRIRTLSLDLRPTILDDLGLLPAMLWHFDRYSTQTGVKVTFKYNGLDRRFPAEIETTAYRVLQEALTNVARYSGQKEVLVYAWADEHNLGLQIIDEGKGFDLEKTLANKDTGGLSGMQERAGLCNGHLLIESNPGEGTSITLNIPIDGNYLERRRHDRNNYSG